MKSDVSYTHYCEVVKLLFQACIMGNSSGKTRYPRQDIAQYISEMVQCWLISQIRLTNVLALHHPHWTCINHFGSVGNPIDSSLSQWDVSDASGAMSKTSGRRFWTYKQRTIPSQPSVGSQLQGGLRQYGSQQKGRWNLTMCTVYVIPASVHTKRFMD